MEPEILDEVTEVEAPSVRVEFIVAPGHTLCYGGARYQPGDAIRVGDQEQMNNWIDSGAIVLA
jgi:hypothetical protein